MSCWEINRKAADSKLSGRTMFAERNEVAVTTLSRKGLGELNSRHGEPWNTTLASFTVLLSYFSTDNLRVVQLGSIFPFSEHLSTVIAIELSNNLFSLQMLCLWHRVMCYVCCGEYNDRLVVVFTNSPYRLGRSLTDLNMGCMVFLGNGPKPESKHVISKKQKELHPQYCNMINSSTHCL